MTPPHRPAEPEPSSAPSLPAGPARGERASGVDTAWVRADAPENPMVITAALLFDELPPFAAVERLLTERLLPQPRFRERIAAAPLGVGPVRWEPDPHFDLAAHLHRLALPAPRDHAALENLLGELASTALPPDRAPWVTYHVEGEGGAGALVVRVHHAVADGAALVRVLATLADADMDTESDAPAHATAGADELAHATAGADELAHATAGGSIDPGALARLRAGAPGPWRAAAALGRLLFARSDTDSSLKREIGTVKRAAFRPGLSLAELKAVARAGGGRLNDVLLAATAGALRELLLARGERADGCNMHAVVPVDYSLLAFARSGLAPEAPPAEALGRALGNHFGMLFAPLPVGEPDAVERLRAVARATAALKRGAQGPALLWLLAAVGHTTPGAERVLLDVFDRKGSLVVTNVVGPPRPARVAGRPVRAIVAWVPQAGHLGLGVSLVSYAGEVALGVLSDARVVPDAGAFAAALVREVETLAGRLGVAQRAREGAGAVVR